METVPKLHSRGAEETTGLRCNLAVHISGCCAARRKAARCAPFVKKTHLVRRGAQDRLIKRQLRRDASALLGNMGQYTQRVFEYA